MDAVVLAGGYATRLWPITKSRPKMLLPVGEQTVLDGILEDLERADPIDAVYLSTNDAFADTFRDFLAAASYDKPELSVESTTSEAEKLGAVGALAELVEREHIENDLLVVAGDNVIGFDIADFVDYYTRHGTPTIAAYDVGSIEQAKSYGIIDLDGNRVVDFVEKPDQPPSTLASIACYAFPAEWVRFAEYLAGENNPDEPGSYIRWLYEQIPVMAYTFDSAWFDIGTPDAYFDAIEWGLDGESVIHPDATVTATELEPPVHVMAGATVRDSQLDRTVVFPNAEITSCALDTCLIDEAVELASLDVTRGLVARSLEQE